MTPYNNSSRNILLVDDEVCFLSSMKRLLRNEPYTLFTAEGGEQALEILKNNKISIIICDYKMPIMNGINLLKKVRQEYPNIIPIILTAVHDLEIALQAINDTDVFKYLLKPIHQKEFIAMLNVMTRIIDRNEHKTKDLNHLLKAEHACIQAYEQDFPGITSLDHGIIKYSY